MILTVLIPTYRRPGDLRRCLEALKRQERPADRVLVPVREGDGETTSLLAAYDSGGLPLEIVRVCVPGVLAAMTAGLDEAGGDILALTDDDTAPFPDWLRRIEAHFGADPRVGGVGGRDWQPVERGDRRVVGKVQWHGRVVGNHHLGTGPARAVDVLKGANCAYRVGPLKTIGFDTRLRGGGAQVHWELAVGLAMKKAGWKLIYDPAIAVDHFIAKRFDEDQNLRGTFNANGISYSAYNETLILLSFLPPVRRLVFVAWAFLVGTRAEPGLAQVARLLARCEPNVWARVRATWDGRRDALASSLGTVKPKEEQPCTSS